MVKHKQVKIKKAVKRHPKRKFRKPYLVVAFLGVMAWALVGYVERPFKAELPTPSADALYKQSKAPIEDRVRDLLGRMSLEEKVGQLALVDKNSLIKTEDIKRYNLGAILSGAGAKPRDNTPAGWVAMIDSFKAEAQKTRLQIPILYGLDANHGHSNIPGATVFPHFIGLGAAGDPALVSQVATATAEELDSTGVNWSYSPSLDAPEDIRWGRVYETFGDNPALNAQLGASYISGLQIEHVAASAKHFLGTGSMLWGRSKNQNFKIDQGRVETTTEEEAQMLMPYRAAVGADVKSVMIGLQDYNGQPIIQNKNLITGKLKGELGFKGFVVSDWYGIYEWQQSKYLATVKAFNAGVDMAMLPFNYKMFQRDMSSAVKNGDISEERLNDAVSRILRVKFELGLFDVATIDNKADSIGSGPHRQLARQAVAKSAVLLKNEASLPLLANSEKVLVAGSSADNIGRQCGAWTVEWQGIDGNWLPGATSILKGIEQTVGTNSVVYSQSADYENGIRAKNGIVVVGEKPYAEGWGDNQEPKLSDDDQATIKKMRSHVDNLIVVIVSGRPLILNQADVSSWDSLVAVWLPGSEGAGVADVLFGRTKFSGKLPIAWPASIQQMPIKEGKTKDGTPLLFARGFGL